MLAPSCSSMRPDTTQCTCITAAVGLLGAGCCWCCYSLQSARLVLLWDLVVRPVLLLTLQDIGLPPMLSVGLLALGSPPGQKLPVVQGTQVLGVAVLFWKVPGGQTAAAAAAAAAGKVNTRQHD